MPLRDGLAPEGPAALADGQWRLTYPGVDLVFGDTRPYFLTAPPDLGDVEITAGDQPLPAADGVVFGRDYRGGRTLVLELGVNEHDEATALEAHSRLAQAWRGDRVRDTPQGVAALHVRRAGRQRVVFGRPRKFATALHMNYQSGYSAATAEFVCVDDVFYDGAEASQVVTMAPPATGGFIPPFVFPLHTFAAAIRPGQLSIGGQLDTWPVLTIAGPITNPKVTVTGVWSVELATTLAWDQTVTIDPRPWRRTVLRNDGGNLAGTMTRGSVRLSDARLPAATDTQLVFSGIDPTGTARLTVTYRNAWPHL